jgi:hypothetical protein
MILAPDLVHHIENAFVVEICIHNQVVDTPNWCDCAEAEEVIRCP